MKKLLTLQQENDRPSFNSVMMLLLNNHYKLHQKTTTQKSTDMMDDKVLHT